MKVTSEEFFKNHDTKDLTKQDIMNAIELLYKINLLRQEYGKPMAVTSGYRTPEHNAKIGGAKNSNHMRCSAIDLADADGKLRAFMMLNNNEMLEKFDLYMEHPKDTPTWCHLQLNPPKSRNRVFGK